MLPRRTIVRQIPDKPPAIPGGPTGPEFAAVQGDISALGLAVQGDISALGLADTGLQAQLNGLGETLDGILTAPVDLPSVPDLYAHWDAASIVAIDGARLASWVDETTGKDAVQATSGNQPQYDIAGINGRPAVYFANSRDDNLVATDLSPASNTVTIFVVAKGAKATSGNRFAFGTSGHSRNIYLGAGGQYILHTSQGSLTGPVTINDAPYLVTGVYNTTSSKARANGIETTGTVGTQTTLPTSFAIGHRTALTAGQGFEGHIGEVLYYDRALTANEAAAVESYLSRKWGIPIGPQVTWWVDSALGSASGDGRSPSRAMNSLATAVASIRTAGTQDATVVIRAPEDTPLRDTAAFTDYDTGGAIRLVSRTPGVPWYLYGSQSFTTGWTHAGSGVYSRAVTITVDIAPFAFVPTLLDADGQPTRVFTRNTATPTTPAAGEYGYSGGTYYLHLAGDADPNSHTVEIATAVNVALVADDTLLTIADGVIRGTQGNIIKAGDASGAVTGAATVYATDTIAEYAGDSPWATSAYVTRMTCYRCKGRYGANDGFNHHGLVSLANSPIMELVDCEGAWNQDEGVSPHEATRLIVRGGRYHHNGHGGLTSVGSAQTWISGAEFDHNRRLDPTPDSGADQGGVAILEQSVLVSTNLYSHDNPGPGVFVDTANGAIWTDNGGTRSGIAHGNGAEDVT